MNDCIVGMNCKENEIFDVVQKVMSLRLENGKTIRKLFQESQKTIEKRIKSNPASIFSLMENYILNIGFETFEKRKRLKRPMKKFRHFSRDDSLEKFILFAVRFWRVYSDIEHKDTKTKFSNRLTKYMNGEHLEPISSFDTELMSYVHLKKCGFDIALIDLDCTKNKNYEFEITKNSQTLKVECKSLAYDAGQSISSNAGSEFINLIKEFPEVKAATGDQIIHYNLSSTLFGKDCVDKHIKDFNADRLLLIDPPNNFRKTRSDKDIVDNVNLLSKNYPQALIAFSYPEGSWFILTSDENVSLAKIISRRIKKALEQIDNGPGIIIYQLGEANRDFMENPKVQENLYAVVGEIFHKNTEDSVAILFVGPSTMYKNGPILKFQTKKFVEDYQYLF